MEKLKVTGPWTGTGGSVDPKGKMGHRSTRTKFTKEENEKTKEAQEESVAIQSPKVSAAIDAVKKLSDTDR